VIRVLVVDDHPVLRRGLADLLGAEPDIEIVGSASDGTEGVELHGSLLPDVVLMDIVMPGEDGVAATRRILEARPTTSVVILTTFADQQKIVAALDAGAAGYLLKDAEPDELIRGVRAAAAGEAPISPRAARELLESRRSRPSDALTAREREVLELVGSGLANKQIAQRLGISEKTVKAHLTRIFTAIGVADRTQAALWAARNL
jgi:DNA-binding NarL/FixJ family response regulator